MARAWFEAHESKTHPLLLCPTPSRIPPRATLLSPVLLRFILTASCNEREIKLLVAESSSKKKKKWKRGFWWSAASVPGGYFSGHRGSGEVTWTKNFSVTFSWHWEICQLSFFSYFSLRTTRLCSVGERVPPYTCLALTVRFRLGKG